MLTLTRGAASLRGAVCAVVGRFVNVPIRPCVKDHPEYGFRDRLCFYASPDEPARWRKYWDMRDRFRHGMMSVCAVAAICQACGAVAGGLDLIPLWAGLAVYGVGWLPWLYWWKLELESGAVFTWH